MNNYIMYFAILKYQILIFKLSYMFKFDFYIYITTTIASFRISYAYLWFNQNVMV